MLRVDLSNLIKPIDLVSYKEKVANIDHAISEKTGEGNDFLGWVDLPFNYDREEFKNIQKCAQEVRDNYEVLVVCGIGGSYLGSRAAIEALRGVKNPDSLEILFLGQTFSSDYTYEVLTYLKDKRFAINVISKSGTTTETSIAFRLLRDLLEQKVGKEKARKAIFATTDKSKGALKSLSQIEEYRTFVLPSDVGGRFSVLTAVGLFPIACAGINIQELMDGAIEARKIYANPNLLNNECYQYAVTRDYLYRQDKKVELFVVYEPKLLQFGEWLKQLFGESEGKNHHGLFPASVSFSTDLHSLGQFVQDGSPVLFETILFFNQPQRDVIIPRDEGDLDGLNYLAGKSLSYVNEKAYLGTLDAHVKTGKVNNIIIESLEISPHTLGHLFYFFERACAMSAYLLGVNPFDQPGVEIYKTNMFHLLGKKGY
ncbi:MAG: glucose-6-phosphate isomerase [Bacilli bacterium]|jgi:glucose-6-phosphate isomerase